MAKRNKALGSRGTERFPDFRGFCGGRRWYTVGVPIWISVSLLGRGTCVWLVQENSRGPLLVLKNTWRSGSRISESMVYGSVDGHHPALAKLYQGEDVLFPEGQRYITTCNLRGPSLNDDIEGDFFCIDYFLKVVGGHFGSIIRKKNYFREYGQHSVVRVLHMLFTLVNEF
jgi:hypothetical protein